MERNWTAEQKRAIVTDDRNLLVSAAAGSGKTAVLAERCVYLVCDAKQPCNADELLVVTFTVAAAEEMRKRIGQRLGARARESDDLRIHRQPLLLAAAQIGTIHGLCSSIIRRNFHVLGIDPAFRLLDEDEAKLLRRDLADALVEDRLEDEKDDAFRRLVEHYAGGSPRRIVDTILGLSAKLSSLLDPKKWLAERRERMQEAAEKSVRESRLGHELLKILESRRATLQSAADRLTLAMQGANGVSGYAAVVRQIADAVGDWKGALANRPFDQAADIIRSTTFDRLPNTKPSPEKELYKPRIDALRAQIKSFSQGVFCFTEAELTEGAGQTLWAIDQLTSLVNDFESRYSAAKQQAGNLDFSDLERLAMRLVRDEASGAPTAVAEEYRSQFKHVLVDEYQDVNELQDTLLSMLADEARGNLFCVGDVKQSIYRFRQADPARFIERYKLYKGADSDVGEVIDLQTNFRSRGPLLESLNRMFEVLMTRESAEVEYNRSQRLVPGATFPCDAQMFCGSPIELHVIEQADRAGPPSDYDADEREAVLIASRIQALLGRADQPPATVFDRAGAARPIEPGDIAILLRTMRIKAERYAAILRRANIPVQADSTTGFFESTEIRDLLSTLRAIDNERGDYDLAAYLRSPLCAIDGIDDVLARVRLAYPAHDVAWFHEAVHCYVRQKEDAAAAALRAALQQLARWRAVARERPVADVIWQILSDTAYSAFCAGLPDGEQRVANLLDLHKRARAFERFRRPTLSRFLHYLDNLEDQADLGMPSVTADGQNAVRILSIHKSKGLEFPVVIVPDLGKEHNLRDAAEKVMVDDIVGLGLRIVDVNKEVHYPSMASAIAQHETRRRALAEELRVLYVAGTRAREHLILVGTACKGDAQSWDDAWAHLKGPLPAGDVLAARSILDWVGQAAAIAEQRSAGSFDRQVHESTSIDTLGKSIIDAPMRGASVNPFADLHPLPNPPTPTARVEQVIERVTYAYPFEPFTTYAAVNTVTSLTKDGRLAPSGVSRLADRDIAFDPVLRFPRTLEDETRATAADIGSATHTVLQLLDFGAPCDDFDLAMQINSFVARRFLRPDQARLVDCSAVQWFVQSELGQVFQKHSHSLRRELDLTYTVPAPGAAQNSEDFVMIRGRLDAVLVEEDGLTVVDYKTDRVDEETIEARAEFYRGQVQAYRTQLERITKRPVKAVYLVFLTPRRVVPM